MGSQVLSCAVRNALTDCKHLTCVTKHILSTCTFVSHGMLAWGLIHYCLLCQDHNELAKIGACHKKPSALHDFHPSLTACLAENLSDSMPAAKADDTKFMKP